MTCRHAPGDPNCSSHPSKVYERAREDMEEEAKKKAEKKAVWDSLTPDAEKFEIVDMERVGANVVLKVKYPNCAKCAYEGMKVMVYLGVTEKQIIKWKKMDPHFAEPQNVSVRPTREAPSPAARFPASKEGWADAIVYATGKSRS